MPKLRNDTTQIPGKGRKNETLSKSREKGEFASLTSLAKVTNITGQRQQFRIFYERVLKEI